MPGVIVDGQDVEKVYTAMKQAAQRARSGQGPTLIEAKTYRYRGHSRTDAAPYRRPGELDEWLKRDPINILAERMIRDGEITQGDLEGLRQAADQTVDEAIRWAMEQPYPTTDSVYEAIWV